MSMFQLFLTLSNFNRRLSKIINESWTFILPVILTFFLTIWHLYLTFSFGDLEMQRSVSLDKVNASDLVANDRKALKPKNRDSSNNIPKRKLKSLFGNVLEEYSITIRPKRNRSSSLSDLTNTSDYTVDFLKYTKRKCRRKAEVFHQNSSGDAVTQYVTRLTHSPKFMSWNFKGKKAKKKEMSQTYGTKFAADYMTALPKDSIVDPNYSSGVENFENSSICSSCSTDAISTQKGAAFPFKSTPSGNLKINSNQVPYNPHFQVVFQSSTVGVLLADPTQAKVNVKFEGKGEPDPDAISQNLTEPQLQYGPRDLTASYVKTSFHANQVKVKCPGVREDKGKDLASLGYAVADPIDWTRFQTPKKQDLFQEFYRRIHNYINTDTVVRIGDEEFHCHRIVLQIYSTFFDQNPMKEIELPTSSVTPEAFHTIYEWMIFGQTDSNKVIKRDNILSLFCAAQYLAIKDLEEQCWSLIVNENLFTEDTAFALFRDARLKGMTTVMDLMTPRVMQFFLPLVASKDFLTLEPEEIMTFLKSNYISVTSEIEILMAAVRWLYGDWSKRRQFAVDLMRCVRFGLISPWQLVDIKRNPDNAEILEVVNEPEVQQMVDDGLAYVIIKYWYGNNSKNYYHWLDVLGLSEPAERNWIGEEKNHVTYKDFLKYLEQFMVPKEQMYQQMAMMQAGRRTDDMSGFPPLPPGSIRGMDADKMDMRRPKIDFPLPATLRGLAGDKDKSFPTMSEFFENRRKSQETGQSPSLLSRSPPVEMDLQLPAVDRYRAPDNVTQLTHQKQMEEQKRQLEQKQQQLQRRKVHQLQVCTVEHDRAHTKHDAFDPPEKDSEDMNTTSDTSSGTADTSITEHMLSSKFAEKRHSVAASYLAAATAALAGPRRTSQAVRPNPEALRSVGQAAASSTTTRVEPSRTHPTPAPHLENNMFSPQISLFNHSKESLARINMNKLSTSILGPSNKNYIAEGSLFNWDRETVLVFGGIDPHTPYGTSGNSGKDIYRFDPVTNVWDYVGDLPEPRHHHSVAFLRGRVYLVGGADPRDDDIRGKSVVVSTVWSYEPVTRSWYSESGLAIPRKNFGLVVHRMALYAIGGQDKKGRVLRSVERFDPKSASWTEVRSMSVARMAVAVAKYREYIWVAGGMTGEKKRPVCKIVECYNSNTNEWTQIHSLRFPRCFATLFSMNDKLFIVGGAGKISEKDKTASSVGAIDVWEWKSREWRQETEMSMPRHGHALAYLGTQLIIIGGVTTIYMRALNNVESYCCERGAWIRGVATLPSPLSGHGAVTLPPASLM